MKDSDNSDFNSAALHYFGLDQSQISHTRSLIIEWFGQEWLDDLALRYASGRRSSISTFHPIYHGLIGGTINRTTTEIVELATYLEYLSGNVYPSSEVLSRCVDEIKSSGKFYAYLFQLMVSARMRLVSDKLSLEPELDGRCPDLHFLFGNEEFVVETTRPDISESSKKSTELFERLFFWLQDKYPDKILHLHLFPKHIDLWKIESEILQVLKSISSGASTHHEAEAYELRKVQYQGDMRTFSEQHMKNVELGEEVYIVGGISQLPSEIPPSIPSVLPKKTLVVDLTGIRDHLQKDISDKIDTATSEKLTQLKPLSHHSRRVYIFINLDAVMGSQKPDSERIINRLKANLFDPYPDLIEGVAFCRRVWIENGSRFILSTEIAFSSPQARASVQKLFQALDTIESHNDFKGTVVGWADDPDSECSCGKAKPYRQCCMQSPNL